MKTPNILQPKNATDHLLQAVRKLQHAVDEMQAEQNRRRWNVDERILIAEAIGVAREELLRADDMLRNARRREQPYVPADTVCEHNCYPPDCDFCLAIAHEERAR